MDGPQRALEVLVFVHQDLLFSEVLVQLASTCRSVLRLVGGIPTLREISGLWHTLEQHLIDIRIRAIEDQQLDEAIRRQLDREERAGYRGRSSSVSSSTS